MKAQVGMAVVMALVAASGCTKQTAGVSGSSTDTMASTPESTIIQQATQTPAGQATLPAESMPSAVTAALPSAPAPIAPVETTAAAPGSTKIGSAREIQQALKQAGFYQGSVDGKVGPRTLQAIREFQQAHQLKADGKVGPRTWAALSSYLNAPAQDATASTQ